MRNTSVGYRLDLGDQLAASLHPDGSLSFVDSRGRGADLNPEQTDQLAALLRLGGQIRAQARRRRAQESYDLHLVER